MVVQKKNKTLAQKLLEMLQVEEKNITKQAVLLASSLNRKDKEIQQDFLNVFAHALYDHEIDVNQSDLIRSKRSQSKKIALRSTQHDLHSLCYSKELNQLIWDRCYVDECSFFTINAAWLTSYMCGLWDLWHEQGKSLTIGTHEYIEGELESSPLIDLLKGYHVRLISPLSPQLIKMIRQLTKVGVASIKIDSFCDEYFPQLAKLNNKALTLLEKGAERAERLSPSSCIARTDRVYRTWVSRVINQQKLGRKLSLRWQYVCLRGAMAKTVEFPCPEKRFGSDLIKMVYCPVALDADSGLWVSRTVIGYSNLGIRLSSIDHQTRTFVNDSIYKYKTNEIVEFFESLARSKRMKKAYQVNEDEVFNYDNYDSSYKSYRLATLEEIIQIGLAGDEQRKYSGGDSTLQVFSDQSSHCNDDIALHAANPWGVYDLASIEEFVWDEDRPKRLYDEYIDEFIRVYGSGKEIRQKSRCPEQGRISYYSRCDFAVRPVLPV